MNDNKRRYWQWIAFGLLTVVACIGLNAALRPASAQFDLTQDARYTIPPALARIASTKIDPRESVKITVYLSESLPRYIAHLPRTIRTRLDEVRRASGGRVEYEFVDPKDDVDLVQELHERFKIAPIPLQDVREGEVTQGSYYLAMLFRYGAQVEQLSLRDLGMELVKEERTLAALPGLIAARIMKVTTPPEEVVVGIASDKKPNPQAQQQQGAQAKPTDGLDPFRERLKNHVNVKDVVVKGGAPIPPDIKTLLLYKPDALAPAEVFQLDQFLMRGGRIIVLLDTLSAIDYDRMSAIQQGLQQEKFSVRAIDTGLTDWLAFYGIVVKPGVVMDRFNHKLARPNPARPFQPDMVDMPAFLNVRDQDGDKKPTGQLEASEITLAGIGALAFLLPAALEVNQDAFKENNPGATLSVLARSSDESWVAQGVTDSVPMSKVAPPPREEWHPSVLVARATGPLRSYWATEEVPRPPNLPPTESMPSEASKLTVAANDRPAQLWVVADSDFVHETWLQAFARGAVPAFQGMNVSASMVMNMIDVAALGSDLVEIRRQRLTDRSVDDARVKKDRDQILFLNIALMPLVFIGFGFLWWIFRSAQTFVPSPRQPVTVPAALPVAPPPAEVHSGDHPEHHS